MAKFSVKNAKRLAFFALDHGLAKLPRRAGEPRAEKGSVAIVRTDAIGDLILWLDAGQALARYYQRQGRAVTLIANAAWADFARELGIFDAVFSIDRVRFDTDPRYHVAIARALQQSGFATAVQPTYSRDLFSDTLVRLTQAPERIGSAGNSANLPAWQKRVSDGWYTTLIAADPLPSMELRRNAEFVRQLAEPSYRSRVSDLRLPGALARDASLLRELPAASTFYVLFPGASWTGKQWPVDAFRQLAERIYRETGWSGVICGGPADTAIANELCAGARVPLLNRAGRTTLSELVQVIARAALLVTNDTAAAHIGAATGAPTLCLLGGGHFGRFLPYEVEQSDERPLPRVVFHAMPCFGCNWRCIYPVTPGRPVPCVEQISLENAWTGVQELLRQSAASPSCAGGVTV